MNTPTTAQAPQQCVVCGSVEKRALVYNDLPLYRCASCGLRWRQEFDVPLSHYEQTGSGTTPERRAARVRNARDRIKTIFRGLPRTGVCDVGAGEGTFLEVLARMGGSGFGIEPGLQYCREAAELGVRIIGSTVESSVEALAREQVRTFTLFHVIEHLPEPHKMLRVLFDALPAGGYLILETPNIDSPILRAEQHRDKLIYPEHLFYFNEYNLRLLLQHSGFSVLRAGRRDFDQYHRPIRDSLWRLTFLPRFRSEQKEEESRFLRDTTTNARSHHPESAVRTLVRATLARLVVASGRLNYMWVVAQKPD